MKIKDKADWTDQMKELMKEMYKDGYSYAHIAIEVSKLEPNNIPITRSSIAGKLSRLGLIRKIKTVNTVSNLPKKKSKPVTRNKSEPVPVTPTIEVTSLVKVKKKYRIRLPPDLHNEEIFAQYMAGKYKPLTVVEDKFPSSRECHWITGDVKIEAYWCKNPVCEGSRWCEYHHNIVYEKKDRKKNEGRGFVNFRRRK